MPLSRRLFDLGVSLECEQTMRLAYQFLAEQRELAYSWEELADGVERPEELWDALLALVRIMAISRREINGIEYFAWLQEFDVGTWLSTRHSAV